MSKTSDTQQTNPLREGFATPGAPGICTMVIFEATGDLTMRKLIPALDRWQVAASLDRGRFQAPSQHHLLKETL